MTRESGTIYNHSALSRNWVHQSLLPGDVQMRRQVIRSATGYRYQEGCQFLLAEQGSGTLLVSGHACPLEPGSCALLFVHHFYSVRSAPPDPLALLFCPFSYSTYAFLTTVSQFDFLAAKDPSAPVFATFPPGELAHIQRIVAALSRPGVSTSGKNIPLLLEWLARLHRQIALAEAGP